MQNKSTNIYKKFIGEKLAEFNRSRNISRYDIHLKSGISQRAIIDIEEGNTNYTIDTLIRYLIASDLYLFFGEKDKRGEVFNSEDILKSAMKNDPKNK